MNNSIIQDRASTYSKETESYFELSPRIRHYGTIFESRRSYAALGCIGQKNYL